MKISAPILLFTGLASCVSAAPPLQTQDLDLSSIQLTAAPGLPSIQDLNLTVTDLLKPVPWVTVDSSHPAQTLERRATALQCDAGLAAERGFPWRSPYEIMWETKAVTAAYNYLLALGTTFCEVRNNVNFMHGWVGGRWVQVNVYTRRGVGYSRSYCRDVAIGMQFWMHERCRLNDAGGLFVTGGAYKANGNGDIWVSSI
ncbi:hypothetical protein QBC34DRAFT_496727 [Podospora aff. communis PSN243]|uniref:SCP domain-containing protein n=1 Tax=Podospora aff. communis PSN243 TaxID=3040156 RepID=A0AAV9GG91_9PEZI|nr:hypothetical protein QBC34DRAFT_496727 [Podospora aff. communis PSN243]